MKKPNTAQPVISTFFRSSSSSGKRPSSPIDLTEDDTPSRKRVKSSPCTSVAAAWAYDPDSPTRKGTASEKRHEILKEKLSIHTASSSGHGKASPPREDGSGSDSNEEFTQMMSYFNSAKGKQKKIGVKKKKSDVGPSGQTWTPLEKQVLSFKERHPGTVLMIEVGYKYMFFGDDAKIAAKDLGMVCFQDRNFLVASVPTQRRDVHLKKLLSQGHRVGIVNQTETAALKKISDNRSGPFDRKLVELYTAATYVDGLDSVDDVNRSSPPPFMCIVEDAAQKEGDVRFSFVSICPATADVVWDEFEDKPMRLELETRLVHTRPAELLLPESLTKLSEKMLKHLSTMSVDCQIRIERFKERLSYTDAFESVSRFYTEKQTTTVDSNPGQLVAALADFPKSVVVALAHAIQYLKAFNIADNLLKTTFFQRFTHRIHMLLSSNTLQNLEVFENETDHSTRGSLLSILDQTKTKFGSRLLKTWVGQPLTDTLALHERIDAVEEIIAGTSPKLSALHEVLKNLPDLAKGLSRIQYGQCTPQELSRLLRAFRKIAFAFDPVPQPTDVGFRSRILNNIVYSFSALRGPIQELLQIVALKEAAEGNKASMWISSERYPAIADIQMVLATIEAELEEELKSIRKQFKSPWLQWKEIADEGYLLEFRNDANISIPPSWVKVSSTKIYSRYRSPTVRIKLEEKAQRQESLEAEATTAYLSFLKETSEKFYNVFREAVNHLAHIDCLISLARVARHNNYVRPQFRDDDSLEIIDGRHPMVEVLRADPFVPNTIRMGGDHGCATVITGPNMGGKSSLVRMVGLIVIMAQIGSYVPAARVKMGIFASVLTRMGASDDIARGRSTFMVEMTQTSEILNTATSRSLVILDELGRGTSTFDGMAIAHATLDHLVASVKCKTLFITHYPMVAADLQKKHPLEIKNEHMAYQSVNRLDGTRDITFLYKLTPGMAPESFGVECGRLAGLPEGLLHSAMMRSSSMQKTVEARYKRNILRKCLEICLTTSTETAKNALDALHISMSRLLY